MTKNNQSLAKALQIIEVMAAGPGTMRLQDIASEIGLPASTVLRFLKTLTEFSYVMQDARTLEYALSMKFCRLGQMVSSQIRIRDIVRPFLIRAAERFGEAASLAIEASQNALYVDFVDGPDRLMRTLQRIGQIAPLNSTDVGKALLSEYSDAALDELFNKRGLDPMTKKTITDKAAFSRELKKVRRLGYAVDNEECEFGIRCVAAPLRDYTGQIVAAISVIGPDARMKGEKMDAVQEGIVSTATEISKTLGYEPPAEWKGTF